MNRQNVTPIEGGRRINNLSFTNPLHVQGQILRLNAQGYATKDLNSSILSAGDVVIQWCKNVTPIEGGRRINNLSFTNPLHQYTKAEQF